jgi:thiamine-phosphate pyrophosphorylase
MLHSEEDFRQMIRILDASLNRIGEGLRFLEEIARMVLNDSPLTLQLKTLRHDLLVSDFAFQQRLLEARDTASDTGADMKVSGEAGRKDMKELVIANARRVQESLRTLEELAKLPGAPQELNTDTFRHARFSVYTIENDLCSKLARQEKRSRVQGLYVIIDTQFCKGRPHLDLARQAVEGGASLIQLRDKTRGKKQILETAGELKRFCENAGVLFIVNDYADIALAVRADGLHLGQDDIPVQTARKLLPVGCLIGCSTTSRDQALAAQEAGADYVAVGAVYPTESKVSTTTPARVVGLLTVQEVKQSVGLPVVAIGGINRKNIADVREAGADAVAVIGAVLGAESPRQAARELADAFEGKE